MSSINKLANLMISADKDMLSAMKQMDKNGHKLLIVQEDSKYSGLISIGDIQRAMIRNVNLNENISKIMRDDYVVASPNNSICREDFALADSI